MLLLIPNKRGGLLVTTTRTHNFFRRQKTLLFFNKLLHHKIWTEPKNNYNIRSKTLIVIFYVFTKWNQLQALNMHISCNIYCIPYNISHNIHIPSTVIELMYQNNSVLGQQVTCYTFMQYIFLTSLFMREKWKARQWNKMTSHEGTDHMNRGNNAYAKTHTRPIRLYVKLINLHKAQRCMRYPLLHPLWHRWQSRWPSYDLQMNVTKNYVKMWKTMKWGRHKCVLWAREGSGLGELMVRVYIKDEEPRQWMACHWNQYNHAQIAYCCAVDLNPSALRAWQGTC